MQNAERIATKKTFKKLTYMLYILTNKAFRKSNIYMLLYICIYNI